MGAVGGCVREGGAEGAQEDGSNAAEQDNNDAVAKNTLAALGLLGGPAGR